MIHGDNDRLSYIVFETGKDWDGNKIAIIGRFQPGDKVIVSKEFRDSIRETYPDVAARLVGVQEIDSIHRQLDMGANPPRYWTGGLAKYTVKGCSFLIRDDDLYKAHPVEYQQENELVGVFCKVIHECGAAVSAPKGATEEKILELAKEALVNCGQEDFKRKVIDYLEGSWDLWAEDIIDLQIDPHYERQDTDLPAGTLSA